MKDSADRCIRAECVGGCERLLGGGHIAELIQKRAKRE
jgi:hypothetical protein